MTFGEKLQQIRMKAGMSQDKLAEMLEVSRQAVSKWERDETMPETDKVIRISEIFNVTTDYLLKDKPKKTNEEQHVKRSSDFFSSLAHLIKTRWYYIGYAAILWGVIDFLEILVAHLIIKMTFPFASSISMVFWLNGVYGAVKIAAGVAIVIFGKRYCERMEGTV